MLRKIIYSDDDLLEKIRSGGKSEDRAIRFLIKKNSGKITKFILFRKGTKEDAEDVLLEGITSLIFNIRKGNFQGDSSIATYLFAICKNIWHKKFKQQERSEDRTKQLKSVNIIVRSPEASFINEEQKNLILALFDHLKSKCREVLYLWSLSYSMKEIAEQMQFSSDQVAMNKKNLCLKELHQRIKTDVGIQQLIRELL